MFERGYREIVSRPSALSGYRAFFTTIAQDAHRPALFHCTTGKDRTGCAAAATLPLLGVSAEDVLYDYELTNRDLLPAMKPCSSTSAPPAAIRACWSQCSAWTRTTFAPHWMR